MLLLLVSAISALVCKTNGLPFEVKSTNAYNLVGQDSRAIVVRMLFLKCAFAPASEWAWVEASEMFHDVLFIDTECLNRFNGYQFCQDLGFAPYSPYHVMMKPYQKKPAGSMGISNVDPWFYVRGIEKTLKFFGPEAPLFILSSNGTKSAEFFGKTKYKVITLYESTKCSSRFLAGLYRRVLHLKVMGNNTDVSVAELDCATYPEQCNRWNGGNTEYPFSVLYGDNGQFVKIAGTVDSSVDETYKNLLNAIEQLKKNSKPKPTPSPLPYQPPAPTPVYIIKTSPLQTRSEYQVCQRYQSEYVAKMDPSTPAWTPGTGGECDVGKHNEQDQIDAVNRLRYYRWLVGTTDVKRDTDPKRHSNTMKTATVLHNMRKVTHYPPSNAKCATSDALQTAATSSLSSGTNNGSYAIDQFIYDPGVDNDLIGHRRNLLNPFTKVAAVGCHGKTESNNFATCVASTDALTPNNNYDYENFIAYPNPGPFPHHLVPERWSLNSKDFKGKSITDFEVHIHDENGLEIPVTTKLIDDHYGTPDALIFTSQKAKLMAQPGKNYHVEVIFQKKYNYKYDVYLTNCSKPIPTPLPTSTPLATFTPHPTRTPEATPIPPYKYCFYTLNVNCNGKIQFGPTQYNEAMEMWNADTDSNIDIYVGEDIVLDKPLMIKGSSFKKMMNFTGPGIINGDVYLNYLGSLQFFGKTALGVNAYMQIQCGGNYDSTQIRHADAQIKSLQIALINTDTHPPTQTSTGHQLYNGNIKITNYKNSIFDDGDKYWNINITPPPSFGDGFDSNQLIYSIIYDKVDSCISVCNWVSTDTENKCKNNLFSNEKIFTQTMLRLMNNKRFVNAVRAKIHNKKAITLTEKDFPDTVIKNYTITQEGTGVLTIVPSEKLYEKVKHLTIKGYNGNTASISFGNQPVATTLKFDSLTIEKAKLIDSWKGLITANNLYADLEFYKQIANVDPGKGPVVVTKEAAITIPNNFDVATINYKVTQKTTTITDNKGINFGVKGDGSTQTVSLSALKPTSSLTLYEFENLSLNCGDHGAKVTIQDVNYVNFNSDVTLNKMKLSNGDISKISAEKTVTIKNVEFSYPVGDNKEIRNLDDDQSKVKINTVTMSNNDEQKYGALTNITITGTVNLNGNSVLLLSNCKNDPNIEININPNNKYEYPNLDLGVDFVLQAKKIAVKVPTKTDGVSLLASSFEARTIISGIQRDESICQRVASQIVFDQDGYFAYCSHDYSSIYIGDYLPTPIPDPTQYETPNPDVTEEKPVEPTYSPGDEVEGDQVWTPSEVPPAVDIIGDSNLSVVNGEELILSVMNVVDEAKVIATNLVIKATLNMTGNSKLSASIGSKIEIVDKQTNIVFEVNNNNYLPQIDLGNIGSTYDKVPKSIIVKVNDKDQIANKNEAIIKGKTLNCQSWLKKSFFSGESENKFKFVCRKIESAGKALLLDTSEENETELIENGIFIEKDDKGENGKSGIGGGGIAAIVIVVLIVVAVVVVALLMHFSVIPAPGPLQKIVRKQNHSDSQQDNKEETKFDENEQI